MDVGFFHRSAPEVAPDLIGWHLTVRGCGGTVIETEAYTPDDPASHSFRGPTLRNRAMFGMPGCAYVYLSYGLHLCLNVVCLPGHAVLFRALAPDAGMQAMMTRRGSDRKSVLCSGPGKLGQALSLSLADNGRAFDGGEFALLPGMAVGPDRVMRGPRIGLSRGLEAEWRFGLAGTAGLSRPFAPQKKNAHR